MFAFEGERIDYFYHALTKISDGGMHPEQYIPKMRKLLEGRYEDNKQYKNDIILMLKLAGRKGSGNLDGLEEEIEPVLRRLKEIEFLNLLDQDLFCGIVYTLPYDMVEKYKEYFLKVYRTSEDPNTRENAMNCLFFIINYLTDKEYYLEAQQLIKDIRAERYMHDFHHANDFVMLETKEVILLFKQNKKEAIPKARKIIRYLDLMRNFAPNVEYFQTQYSLRIDNFNKLNKTGIDLFDYDDEE